MLHVVTVVCPGKSPTDQELDAMMSEAPGPINFTMFLTMFGEKLNGTDPEDVIKNAFACFDEENKGVISQRDVINVSLYFSLSELVGAWWRWALVSPDGVAPIRMVGVSASVNLPLHHEVQKFSFDTSSPGWSRKKGS